MVLHFQCKDLKLLKVQFLNLSLDLTLKMGLDSTQLKIKFFLIGLWEMLVF